MERSQSALIVFTLSPEAEARRKPLGLGRPEQAARVFAALLEHVHRVGSALSGVDLLPAMPPSGAGPAEAVLVQRGRSFGESLRLAVEDAFSLGYRRVLVIGNDAPEISRGYLERAFGLLDSGRRAAVVGPAADGGYALLGLTAPCADAFEGIPWGTSHVLCLTEERLTAAGFAVFRLTTLQDIDDPRGLARFLKRSRRGTLRDLVRRLAHVLTSIARLEMPFVPSAIVFLLATSLGLRAPPRTA